MLISLIHNRRGADLKKSWRNQSPVFIYFTNSSMFTTRSLQLSSSWYEVSPASGHFSGPCLELVSSTAGWDRARRATNREAQVFGLTFWSLDPESARILCLMTCDLSSTPKYRTET